MTQSLPQLNSTSCFAVASIPLLERILMSNVTAASISMLAAPASTLNCVCTRQHQQARFPLAGGRTCLSCNYAPRQHVSQPAFSHSPPLTAYCSLGDSVAGKSTILCYPLLEWEAGSAVTI